MEEEPVFFKQEEPKKKRYRENSLVIEEPFQKSDPLEILCLSMLLQWICRREHCSLQAEREHLSVYALHEEHQKNHLQRQWLTFQVNANLKVSEITVMGEILMQIDAESFSENQLLSELCWITKFGRVKHLLSIVMSGAVKCLCGHSVQSQRKFSGFANCQFNQGLREVGRWELRTVLLQSHKHFTL